ncbi:hypothetical protein HK097_001700 [Rhizophlyctis rosea]|uniref:Uncharacterized protein n=1 Tax=Rhizophlyctis rosea TaxID=64517 RepID=A0AAD5X0M4_9FUNG|nr:hypothetical protein HK097_001700 [Rhizophlyctis rosea]
MANLRSTLAGYTRNQERLRRKSLKLALILKLFSENEATNLSAVLQGVSDLLTDREKERSACAERIKMMSQGPLKLYAVRISTAQMQLIFILHFKNSPKPETQMICKGMRAEVKLRETARDKEQKQQQNLDRVMIKEAGNRTKITQSQMELAGASHEVQRATAGLVDSVQRFESKKRADIQSCLGEMIWSEIQYHSRALEILTNAHQLLYETDLEADLEVTSLSPFFE